MNINPGGRLRPEDVVGRDELIARYWKILERQGLVLSAERRIGKTSIVHKMHTNPESRWTTLYQDLEGVHTVRELIDSIYTVGRATLSGGSKVAATTSRLSKLIPRGLKDRWTPDYDSSWADFLMKAIDDLIAGASPGNRLLLIWDEFPLMIYNIARSESEDRAIQLLDLLRTLRQAKFDSLRLLLTGSIGLPLILRRLAASGNANAPINDMYKDTVPPLAESSSTELAAQLLKSIEVSDSTTRAELAAEVAQTVQGFPYYIHHVADQLQMRSRPVSRDDLDSSIEQLVCSDSDPADFGSYRRRIDTYYPSEAKTLVLGILSVVAQSSEPLGPGTIANLVSHQTSAAKDVDIRRTLALLVEDHYLTRRSIQNESKYEFRWRLVRDWWRYTQS